MGANSGAGGGTAGAAGGATGRIIWMMTTLTATNAHNAATPASHGVALFPPFVAAAVSDEDSGVSFATAGEEAGFFAPEAAAFGSGVVRIVSTSLFISPVLA
jgi:hypothetical protein